MKEAIDIQRIANLITRYLAKIITSQELNELEKWLQFSYGNQLFFAEFLLELRLQSVPKKQGMPFLDFLRK